MSKASRIRREREEGNRKSVDRRVDPTIQRRSRTGRSSKYHKPPRQSPSDE